MGLSELVYEGSNVRETEKGLLIEGLGLILNYKEDE